jgi:hypothetical protein
MDPLQTVMATAVSDQSIILDPAVTSAATATHSTSALAPSAVSAAISARVAGLVPSGLGLPGYPTSVGTLVGLLSPTCLPRHPPPGFSTTRPLVADTTWASTTLSTDSTMSSAIAAIQAALTASQEREHAASRALEQERALAATLTAQMATAQRLVIGPPSVDQATPPAHPRGSPRLWSRCWPHRCSPCPGGWTTEHPVPRVRRSGPGVLPLPSLEGAGPPHLAALRPRRPRPRRRRHPSVPGLVPDRLCGPLLAPWNHHRRAPGHHPRPGRHRPSGVARPRRTVPREPGRSRCTSTLSSTCSLRGTSPWTSTAAR